MEGTEETTKPQEMLSTSNEFTALQGRILLKGSALDPNNANIVENDINQEKLSETIDDYTIFEKLSKKERRQQNNVERNQLDQAIDKWANDTSQVIHQDFSTKKGFDKQKIQRWNNTLSKLLGHDIKSASNEETKEKVKELGNKYFTGENKDSNIELFIKDVLQAFSNEDGTINYDALNENLDCIKWFANIFGSDSSQIIAQLIDAQAKLKTNPDDLIRELKKDNRINSINDNEKRLLGLLWENVSAQEEEPEKPIVTVPEKPKSSVNIEGENDLGLKFGKGEVQKEVIENHYGVQDKVYVDEQKKVAAVADGVTSAGIESAETASDLAHYLSESLAKAIELHGNNYEKIYDHVNSEMKRLDLQLKSKYKDASSTAIAGAFNDNGEFVLIHIGDTEGRLLREREISHLDRLYIKDGESLYDVDYTITYPKSSYGTQVQAEAKDQPNQLGTGAFHDIRMGVYDISEGDKVILSSDGIGKVLSENEIQDIVSKAQNPQEAETNLVKAACSKGLQDDYGVVVIFT